MNTQLNGGVEGEKAAPADLYQKLKDKLAGPNGDWWRLQLEKLRGGQQPARWSFPADVVARILPEFERIAVDSCQVRLSELRRRYPGALVIDLTGQAGAPWRRFSPLYPHGGIPVPYWPGYSAVCVKGIWQGLKVFENEDVDLKV
jgi:hypothetical protein